MKELREDDVVIITADHGCDPAYTATTDHTREYIAMLAYRKGEAGANLGTVLGFDSVGQRVEKLLLG